MTVHKLFRLLPPQDVLDAEAFLAAAVALFAGYPAEVGERAIALIAGKSDRPTLKIMRQALDEIFAPIERESARQAARASHEQHRALPRPKRTPEQQARVDAQVAEAKRLLAEKITEGTTC